jgi:hypothetical protein
MGTLIVTQEAAAMHDVGEETDGSVVFSLHELRALERERRAGEAAAQRARQEAERQARAVAAACAIAAAESARLAAAERARADEEARARRRREDEEQLIALEERLAREADERLARARAEAQARAERALRRASPLPLVAALVAATLAVGGGAVAWIVHRGDAQLLAQRRAAAARERAVDEQLSQARDVAERQLEARLALLRQRVQAATAELLPPDPPPPIKRPGRVAKKSTEASARKTKKSILDEEADPLGASLLDNL